MRRKAGERTEKKEERTMDEAGKRTQGEMNPERKAKAQGPALGAAQEAAQGEIRPEKDEKRRLSAARPPVPFPVLGGASALYALFYTFCLYRNASGITYPFFIAGTLFYFFFCIKRCGVPSGSSAGGKRGAVDGVYAGFILLLGVSVCLTADGKIHLMTKTGIFLLTVTLVLRQLYRAKEWDFSLWLCRICRSLAETPGYLDAPVRDGIGWLGQREKGGKSGRVGAVAAGLFAAIPFLIVILALLASADAVFSDLLARAVKGFRLWDLAGMAAMAAAVFFLCYAYVRGIFADLAARPPREGERRKKYPSAAALAFTSVTAVVYLIFCGVQVVYLFWGKLQLPRGLTWAQYARQGFFQLLFVCLINLALVLICLALFEESRALKAMLTAISLMTYIMIASSACRMLLYIRNYHLTFLRLMVLWALAVIALIFAGVIVSIYRKGFPLFSFCAVTVAILYLAPAFGRPDYWIARYNAAAMEAGEYDDYGYLSTLCADAAPALLDPETAELWDETWPFQDWEARMKEGAQHMGIRGFNLSRWAAGELAGRR